MVLTPLKKAAIQAEYLVILDALEQANFNKRKAAEILGVDRSSITNKVKLYKRMKAEEKQQSKKKSIPGTY